MLKYKKKENFLLLALTACFALIFCTISLPRFYYDSSDLRVEAVIEGLEFFKNFKPNELNALYMLKHLLIVPNFGTGNRTIVFASKSLYSARRYGPIEVYPMEAFDDYIKIFFKDCTRAFRGLKYQKVKVGNLELQIVTNNEVEMNRKWQNSRFIKCLGLVVSNETRVIPESYIVNLGKFRDYVEHYNSTIVLFGGTLLGWFRECSFIRDTTDVDFAMKIEQLDDAMLEDIQNTTMMSLYWILGKKEDSLELSVYMDKIKIDLFFLYRNTSYDWVGGMVVPKKQKLRWFYPRIDEICTGDLLGMLFNVPCDVEDVLRADYGETWRISHKTSKFKWDQSHKNVHRVGFWKPEDWKQVYRTFHSS